jgi:hypothetical protein
MHILSYCATSDFLARRYICIISEFLKVVQNRIQSSVQGSPPQTRRPVYTANASIASSNNPAESLPSINRGSKPTSSAPVRPPLKPAISQISQAPMGSRVKFPQATVGMLSRIPGLRSQCRSHTPDFRTLIEISRRIGHGKGKGKARAGLLPASLDTRFSSLWKPRSDVTRPIARAVTMAPVRKEPTVKMEDREWQSD